MSSSTSPVSQVWSSIKRHAKEHHESVNAAYSSYYGTVLPPRAAVSSYSAASAEPSRRSSVDKAWGKIKKHAKDHHNSVNAAYTQYYGVTTPRTSPVSSTETSPRVSVDRH